VTARRTAGARRNVPGSQPAPWPAPNGQASRLDFAPVLPGLVACARCAAVLVDSEAAKATHGRFHEGLRQLWQNGGRT
jgi:hypothetical protein